MQIRWEEMLVVSHSLEKSKSSWLAEQDILSLRCQNCLDLGFALYSPAGSRVESSIPLVQQNKIHATVSHFLPKYIL